MDSKIKSDQEVIIESMAERIRGLECELKTFKEYTHEENESQYNIGVAIKGAFDDFIRSQDKSVKERQETLLNFEQYIESELEEAHQGDSRKGLLEAYLWVFEIANGEDELEGGDQNYKAAVARITANMNKYNKELREGNH